MSFWDTYGFAVLMPALADSPFSQTATFWLVVLASLIVPPYPEISHD